MAEIIPESCDDSRLVVVSEPGNSNRKLNVTERLVSLDVFRGLTVALMILVDHAGGEWPAIAHAPWHGCNLADFVMPFFLFIVGVSVALALKRIANKFEALKKVVLRTCKLLFWGLLLQGGFSHAPDRLTYGVDINMMRLCGILQRIALSYLIVALVEIFTRDSRGENMSIGLFSIFKSYYWHWLVGASVLVIYLATLYGTYIPDWKFVVNDRDSILYGKTLSVSCGVRGKLDPPCNAVGFIDRQLLGLNHLYGHPAWRRTKMGHILAIAACYYCSIVNSISLSMDLLLEACTIGSPHEGPLRRDAPAWCHAPFEPEGVLSSISAVLSTIIGVHFGHVILHFKGHSARLKHWISTGFALLILGLTLHFTNLMPINKQLYSFSYTCVTSGAAALVFSLFYTLVDVWGSKYMLLPLKWIGMNAMLVYVMGAEGILEGFINGWYFQNPSNTLINWIQEHVFIRVWHSRKVGVLLYVIFAEILFWGVIAGVFHRNRIYWKL